MSGVLNMMIIPINIAEAIIEPFFNGGTSDQNEKRNTFVLDHYACSWHGGAVGRVEQMWDGVYAFVQGGTGGRRCLTMSRECALDVSGYDTFIAFVGIPPWVKLTVEITVDGVVTRVIDRAPGGETTCELEGGFTGERLSRIVASFALSEAPESTTFHLKWFGLANEADRSLMLSKKCRYTPEWPGFLADGSAPASPHIGIYFDEDGLERIRRMITSEPFAGVFGGIRKQATEDLAIIPEEQIGEVNPGGTDRYIRVRRRALKDLSAPAVRLAFVGLVDNNAAMSRLAARMALSLAFCETWDESTIGHLPGSIWHHRSFSQERAIKAAALVLDWAGNHLTAEAKRVIRDAIIMKGLPRLENDFRTIEYIRRMNQGIVFNAARIIGMLALIPVYPRYRAPLEEAERDLHEMIDAYVHADGGTLEGCGYWNYTFSSALPQLYLLARYHERPFAEYVPEAVRRTGDYPLAMLSAGGDGTNCLPVNDGHTAPVAAMLAAAFVRLLEHPTWRAYYARRLAADHLQPSFEHLIMHPVGFDREKAAKAPLARPRFIVLPDVGQVDSVRITDDGMLVHLHVLSGPVEPGHFHEDKGSFILEVGAEMMLIDRGICNYGHPMTMTLGKARMHNLLTPDSPIPVEQPNDVPGGSLIDAGEHAEAVWVATDNARAWAPGIFSRSIRRIVSPDPALLLIDDEVVLTEPRNMTFNLHTRKEVDIDIDGATIRGTGCQVGVEPVNWAPSDVRAAVDGIDEHLEDVTAIRLRAAKARSHRLITAIEVLPAEGAAKQARWEYRWDGRRIVGSRGESSFSYDTSGSQAAVFEIVSGSTAVRRKL